MSDNPRYKNFTARVNLRNKLLRETTHCALCGRRLPTKEERERMRVTDPEYPVVDEIYPMWAGGSPIDEDNTQLVHRACNAKKGGKLPVNPLMQHKQPFKASRKWI
nr:MAG TPA: CRISPR-associated endonuclease [Caudoviricetes sp.]